jgi:hypothetical protein
MATKFVSVDFILLMRKTKTYTHIYEEQKKRSEKKFIKDIKRPLTAAVIEKENSNKRKKR